MRFDARAQELRRRVPDAPLSAGAPIFRAAGQADTAALLALVHAAYREEESRMGWTTEADLLGGQRTDAAEIEELMADPAGRILVAELDGELVATCHIKQLGGGAAYLGLFSVRPRLQGRGLGRAVVGEAERIAAEEWSAPEMRMLVLRQRPELIAWYERLGYRRTGRSEPFPHHDERFGRPKVDDLEFLELIKPLR
jgi:ribosomal protein S18 acetylase RimI-like enzyme